MQGSTKLCCTKLCHYQQCMQGSTKLCCTALHTLLMMTAEFMLSKRPVLRFTAALFSSLSYFRPIFIVLRYCFTNSIYLSTKVLIVF